MINEILANNFCNIFLFFGTLEGFSIFESEEIL